MQSRYYVYCSIRPQENDNKYALKHAEPREINVKLEWTSKHINIVVKDDGRGFDKEKVKPNSFGLIGLAERVELLNGTLEIKSKLGQGTVMMFKIPFPE